MYSSLESWLDVSAVRKPFVSFSGSGTKVFGDDEDFLCYPVGKVTNVVNAAGIEVVSNTHLYVKGSQTFDEQDNVIFDGVERPVKAIAKYFRNGEADLRVVYI